MAEEEKLTDEISIKKPEEKELNISKVVLKTGLLTALVFLLVLIFAFTITAFVSPKFVSDMSFKLGTKNLSARFAIAQYERTKDINNLALAVERSISSKKHKSIAKYGKILVEFETKSGKKEFKDFAKFKDENLNEYYKENGKDTVSDYYNFIYGNYVYSLYKVKEKDNAYDTAVEALKKTGNGITEYINDNPMHRYINAYIEDNKRLTNDKLLLKLEEMYDELGDDVYNLKSKENSYGLNICVDLIRIYEALGNDAKANHWIEICEELLP